MTEFLAAVKEADRVESRVRSHMFGSRMTLSVTMSIPCVKHDLHLDAGL